MHDLIVIHEHPEWQKPLFAALEKRGLNFGTFDLKAAAFSPDDLPKARLYFNQASPSAYLRGNTRAVPLCMALLKSLEETGARVLNGSSAFALELSKTHQAALLRRIGVRGPRTWAFNDPAALAPIASALPWPLLLKPEQGGSGARMFKLDSHAELVQTLKLQPQLWEPDNLLLLQEIIDHDPAHGIVRMELLGGKLLYAMRVVSHGRFNLCPSETCNPEDGEGACDIAPTTAPAVEFIPYPEVSAEAVTAAERIAREGNLDVCGLECIETPEGPVFYDINANSNLRGPIGAAFGFDPFERVVDFLEATLKTIA